MKKQCILFALFSMALLSISAQEKVQTKIDQSTADSHDSNTKYMDKKELYDVNYDPPKVKFDGNIKIFQDIYIQYEDLINAQEMSIRKRLEEEEAEKYRKKLEEALKTQKEEVYTKEADAIRKKERELINEEFQKAFYDDVKEKFEAELREELSLENKVLEEKYKNDVRKELETEYEERKNSEIQEYKSVWEEETKQKFIEETNLIAKCIIFGLAVVLLVVVLLVIFLSLKKSLRQRDKNIKEGILTEYFANSYLEQMQKYNGKTESIREELENSSVTNEEKELRRKAVNIAQDRYKQNKETRSINEYAQEFKTLADTIKKAFNDWNSASGSNDEEWKKAVCNNFFFNINKFTETATEAYQSKNNTNKVKALLSTYTKTLENTREQVQNLAKCEKSNDIKIQLVSIYQKYGELSKKFSKGDFK